MFQQDRRTTVEVEATRCMRNGKSFRNAEQKADAKANAFKAESGRTKGTIVSYTPTSQHGNCVCGKRPQEQCQLSSIEGRNNRVKRLR